MASKSDFRIEDDKTGYLNIDQGDSTFTPTIKNKYPPEKVGTYEETTKRCARCGNLLFRLILPTGYFSQILQVTDKLDFRNEMQYYFCRQRDCGKVELIQVFEE